MLQLGNPCAARKDPKRPKIPCATTKTQHGQINIFEKLFKECGFTLVNIDTFGFVSWLCYLAAAAASAKSLQSCPTLCNPWTVGCQAPLSMEFSRQDYWSRLPGPSPWDLPNPGIKPGSPALQAYSLPTEPPGKFPPGSFFKYAGISIISQVSVLLMYIFRELQIILCQRENWWSNSTVHDRAIF